MVRNRLTHFLSEQLETLTVIYSQYEELGSCIDLMEDLLEEIGDESVLALLHSFEYIIPSAVSDSS